MSKGFFLGKFMPMHEGHEMIIRTAARLVDTLVVVVGTRDEETLDGYERYSNVWAATKDIANVSFVHLHKSLPQKPSDDPDNFWTIWTKEIVEVLAIKDITHVFGSDDYIVKLAEVLGAIPVQIDPERLSVPISATKMRQLGLQERWQFIPDKLKGYYRQRVVLLGPESSGKTTLARSLAMMSGDEVYAYEYGRTYDANQKGEWLPRNFDLIRERQRAIANTIFDMSGPVCIEDTDAIQTNVWQDILINESPVGLDAIPDPADLYLLLSPEVEFIQDGTRYYPELSIRKKFYTALKCALDMHNLNYREITGADYALRLTQARDAINLHLNQLP